MVGKHVLTDAETWSYTALFLPINSSLFTFTFRVYHHTTLCVRPSGLTLN